MSPPVPGPDQEVAQQRLQFLNRGEDLWRQGNPAAAMREYEHAAAMGDSESERRIGYLWYRGEGVAQNTGNYFHWTKLAAEHGNSSAQLDLAEEYMTGTNIAANPTEAAVWYSKAAEKGLGVAQISLGLMFAAGDGVPKDLVQARSWMEKCAAQNWPICTKWLASH